MLSVVLFILASLLGADPPHAVLGSGSPDHGFRFVRIQFDSNAPGMRSRGGAPWSHDHPRAELQFYEALERTTRVYVEGPPLVLTLKDERIFEYPLLYLCEPGYWTMDEEEVENLRAYLDRGGFILFDDFRGPREWQQLYEQMKRVFPDREPVEISPDHPIWNIYYEVDPVVEKAIDLLLILHADHEQNCSTSTVRLAGSSGANPYSAIAAGISALWGPAHGGANEAVLKMLGQIGNAKNIPKYVAKAKDKDDSFRLMGFGHRVYKNFDPRATIIRDMCHKVLAKLGRDDDPLFELALELEKVALEDDYFVEKRLYPNVDFYSGIIYRALGFQPDMFTVMFAIARTVGWVSHWQEMITDPEHRIGRPRQLYVGPKTRNYIDLGDR